MLFSKLRNLSLEGNEKKTFALHSAHMFLEGIVDGALLLSEFILIKSLLGTNYQIGVLFQFSVVILLFSIIFNEIVKRTFNKKKLLRLVAIVTRLPLAVFIFFPNTAEQIVGTTIYPVIFLSIFLFYYFYKPMILPTINLFLRENYQDKHFGPLFGYATSVKKIVTLVTTFAFGALLDWDNYAFTYIFPILAGLGILSVFLLSLIPYSPEPKSSEGKRIVDSIKTSFSDVVRILKKNKPYRDFEVGFMFYGFAWMATAAVITIFMEKALHLNYTSVAFYKNAYHILAIVLLPLAGRLVNKLDPRKFGMFTFLMLLLYLAFIGITEFMPVHHVFWGIDFYWMLVMAFVFYGVFTATMAMLWGIGSSYFCTKEEAGTYQAAHLSFVGFRALFAPLVGVFFYETLGFAGTFGIGVLSLAIGIAVLFISKKKHRLEVSKVNESI